MDFSFFEAAFERCFKGAFDCVFLFVVFVFEGALPIGPPHFHHYSIFFCDQNTKASGLSHLPDRPDARLKYFTPLVLSFSAQVPTQDHGSVQTPRGVH
jgi:hypothetical protein